MALLLVLSLFMDVLPLALTSSRLKSWRGTAASMPLAVAGAASTSMSDGSSPVSLAAVVSFLGESKDDDVDDAADEAEEDGDVKASASLAVAGLT